VCCQPRKIAAVSLAQQVAAELDGGPVGGLVGYWVGADSCRSPQTRILFLTDQVLLNQAVKVRYLQLKKIYIFLWSAHLVLRL
jgi:HrpA-like RNA helicase